MNETEEKRLEQMYSKERQFFYEKVTKILDKEDCSYDVLTSIESKIENKKSIDEKEFEILGSYCYLIGLDFASMPFYNKKIQENVSKRLSKYTDELNEKFIEKLLNVSKNIKNEYITEAKEFITNRVNDEINRNTFDTRNIISDYKKILDSSILDIKYAVDCCELSNKTNLTYNDLLKINNSINETLKYVGYKSMNSFRNIFNNKEWINLLKKSAEIFNDVKFGVIFYDSILTIQEALNDKYNDLNVVKRFITNDFSEEDYNKCKEEFESKQKDNNKEELKEKVVKKPLLSDEDSKKLMQDNPIQFLLHFVEDCWFTNQENISDDYKRCEDFTLDNFFEAFDNISKDNTDFLKDFYSWLKGSKNFIKKGCKIEKPFVFKEEDILNKLKPFIEEKSKKYKEHAENICRDIPETHLAEIKHLFDQVIGGLILETQQQKQYLMSNFFDNQIKTYQNLIQILQLVESCNIKGSHIQYYKKLSDYVKKLPIDFDITIDIDKSYKELSLYIALKEFIEKCINVNQEKEETKE